MNFDKGKQPNFNSYNIRFLYVSFKERPNVRGRGWQSVYKQVGDCTITYSEHKEIWEMGDSFSYLDSGGNHMFIRVINMPIKLILLLIK